MAAMVRCILQVVHLPQRSYSAVSLVHLWCFSGASEMLFLPSVVASLAQLWIISCSSLLKHAFPPVLCSSPAPLFAGCTFSLISIKFSSSLLSQTLPASSDSSFLCRQTAGEWQVSRTISQSQLRRPSQSILGFLARQASGWDHVKRGTHPAAVNNWNTSFRRKLHIR